MFSLVTRKLVIDTGKSIFALGFGFVSVSTVPYEVSITNAFFVDCIEGVGC